MNSLQFLISYNVGHLEQGLRLLDQLDDGAYTTIRSPVFDSGIGEHLRHILEHYQCFLSGLPSGKIDYDARTRDLRISSDRGFARVMIEELITDLNNPALKPGPLDVKMAGSERAEEESPWSQSTVKRELQYLQAHTIHHYALISVIMQLLGYAPSSDFGVAPSTLQHRLRSPGSSN